MGSQAVPGIPVTPGSGSVRVVWAYIQTFQWVPFRPVFAAPA